MKKLCSLSALLVFTALIGSAQPREDQLTPLVASPLVDNARPVTGTDGKVHLVYELVLTNTNITPATPKKIDVLASDQTTVLATFKDNDLLTHFTTPATAQWLIPRSSTTALGFS